MPGSPRASSVDFDADGGAVAQRRAPPLAVQGGAAGPPVGECPFNLLPRTKRLLPPVTSLIVPAGARWRGPIL